MSTLSIIIATSLALTAQTFQPVDMNIASAEQIALLPGIGKRLAENIVAERKRRNGFVSGNDLSSIPGLTAMKLQHIETHIAIGRYSKKAAIKKIIDDEQPSPRSPISREPILDLSVLEQRMLRHQGLANESDLSLAKRVRLAAWLPNLTTYVDTDHGEIATKKTASDARQSRDGRSVGFGIKVSFDLDKLIYNKDELDVARLALAHHEKRRDLTAELHKNYFRYVELAGRPVSEKDHEFKEKLIAELARTKAALNSLSGGALDNSLSEVP